MSRSPDQNSQNLPLEREIDNEVETRNKNRAEAGFEDSSVEDSSLEQIPRIEPDHELPEAVEISSSQPDDDEDELSLSQLSQAYAKIKRASEVDQTEAATLGTTAPVRDRQLQSTSEEASRKRDPDDLDERTSTVGEKEIRDNAGCPITPSSIVEAIVFVGLPEAEKLTLKKIASLLRDVSPNEVKTIITQLNDRYEKAQAAYRINVSGDLVSMELHESMLPFQAELSRTNRGVRLNAATIEVLAVIAYNQPITRERIDETRKKASGAIVTQLVRRGLIAPIKREPGSQRQQFATTEKFLQFFHLADLADLPQGGDVSDLDELLS